MVQVDVPELPRNLNVKYRPPRVSLFPPSYRDRAYLRSIHRDVLRQLNQGLVPGATIKTDMKSITFKLPNGLVVTTGETKQSDPPALPAQVTSSVQTTESHCYHECPVHKHGGKDGKGDGGKDGKKQGGKDQDGKKQDSKKGDGDSDDDSQNKTDKGDKKQDKSKDGKGKKDDSGLKIPNSLKPFLPYPFTSANADAFWGNTRFLKPFPEKPFTHKEDPSSLNIDYRLEAARRADERYIWDWLQYHEGATQREAFQWLADRDAQRQARIDQIATDLSGLRLENGSRRARHGGYLDMPMSPGLNHGGFGSASPGLFERNRQPFSGYHGPIQQQGWNGGAQPFNHQEEFQQQHRSRARWQPPQQGPAFNNGQKWNGPQNNNFPSNQGPSGWSGPNNQQQNNFNHGSNQQTTGQWNNGRNNPSNNFNQNQRRRPASHHVGWGQNNQNSKPGRFGQLDGANSPDGGWGGSQNNNNNAGGWGDAQHDNNNGWAAPQDNNNNWGGSQNNNNNDNNNNWGTGNDENVQPSGGGFWGADKNKKMDEVWNNANQNDEGWNNDQNNGNDWGNNQNGNNDGWNNNNYNSGPKMSGAKGLGPKNYPSPNQW